MLIKAFGLCLLQFSLHDVNSLLQSYQGSWFLRHHHLHRLLDAWILLVAQKGIANCGRWRQHQQITDSKPE